jgi:toxin ParE1/3/4
MMVAFSKRALADLRNISAYSRREFGARIAAALEARIQAVIGLLRNSPLSAPKVEHRDNIRVASLGRYPYRVFYRVSEKEILILHIRHASRMPY